MRRANTSAEKLRLFNAVIASVVAAFFLVHSGLGTASFSIESLVNSVPWLVWGMLGAVGVHVVVSVAATVLMLTDAKRPPSSRKKRHFVLKWVTGALLALVIGMHLAYVIFPEGFGLDASQLKVLFLLLLAALAWHVGIATKSLARDLGIGKKTRDIMRAGYVLVVLALIVFMLSNL